MHLSNDDRGWIMTGLSGVACIFGASFICIDILIRQFPGQRNFRIQDSDVFLSVSLSLSFGVMLFSALYKMLPSSKKALQDAGYSAKEASWILIICFLGGVVGIQILSRLMHSYMSHDIIDCEHTHEDEEVAKKRGPAHGHGHGHGHSHHHDKHDRGHGQEHNDYDSTEQIRRTRSQTRKTVHSSTHHAATAPSLTATPNTQGQSTKQSLEGSRPPLHSRLTESITSLAAGKAPSCTLDEPCHGYSDPCGQECFKKVMLRSGSQAPHEIMATDARPAITSTESTPLLQTRASVPPLHHSHPHGEGGGAAAVPFLHKLDASDDDDHSSNHDDAADHHHHHVPTNAFLSIGLQTSIAIALHKLPEGFITYATNHANPQLGVSVFLALFIHNITEGFALALPLYLAINNRLKAMAVSFVLGGLSQPLGAGIAALWFHLAGDKGAWAPSEGVYGGMFAVTAGIMASVALQLFSESLELTHSKNLCMTGAFVGMAMLGISSALTA